MVFPIMQLRGEDKSRALTLYFIVHTRVGKTLQRIRILLLLGKSGRRVQGFSLFLYFAW